MVGKIVSAVVIQLLLQVSPLLVPAVGGLLVLSLFMILERRERRDQVLLVILSAVAVDVVLYPDTDATQLRSLLHPVLLGQDLRLTEILVPTALCARFIIHGLPRQVESRALPWLLFTSWMLVSAVGGVLALHNHGTILRQAMLVINLCGGVAVASGLSPRALLADDSLPRFLRCWAMVAGAVFVLDLSGVRITSSAIPMLPLLSTGEVGADAATVFGSFGLLGLATGLCMSRQASGHPLPGPRFDVLASAGVLLLAHLAQSQRAARLGLYLALVLLLGVMLAGRRARRRIRLTDFQAVVLLGTLGALVMTGVLVTSATRTVVDGTPGVVDAATSPDGIGFTTRQGSIQSRFNQWDVVLGNIRSQPILGAGLGGQFVHFDEGSRSFVQSDISHNIVLDTLQRTGAVGLLLLGWCLVTTVCLGWVGWRRLDDDAMAGLVLGASVVVVELVIKGMVESVFEKNRLALLLGCACGIVLATAGSMRVGRDPLEASTVSAQPQADAEVAPAP